jgi:DNA-binding MarR family transcriptional regulator
MAAERDQSTVSIKRVIRIAEFRAALREFESGSDQVARRLGLTPQRYLLMLFIKGASGGSERATMTELKERMKLSPNTVSDLVARAEDAGLVVRTSAKHDLRVGYVTLTPEGDRLLQEAIVESDDYRREFAHRFKALPAAFRAAQRR